MEVNPKPSYLPEAIRFGAILAVITTFVSYMSIYNTISTPPTGSLFSFGMLVPAIACLIAAFGGLLVVRSFAKETGLPMKAGQGAVIGLVTGAIIAVIAILIGQIWTQFIDPTMMDRYADAMIANFEAIPNLSDDQRNAMIDGAYTSFQESKTFMGIVKASLINLGMFSVLNLITGIIGVAIFAEKEDVL
jgi:hypothetical protein